MKRRWSILFWSSLATLAGVSWLASRFGLRLSTLLNVGLVMMIAGTAVAFFAMVRAVPAKWPAAIVLICAGPMALDVLRVLPDVMTIVRYLGAPFALVIGGTIATIISAIGILALKPADPPKPPPVAPARVVD